LNYQASGQNQIELYGERSDKTPSTNVPSNRILK
jgi:hypothetical protein